MPFVRVYAGAGASERAVAATVEALNAEVDSSVGVSTISGDELVGGAWQADTVCVVMPGGRDVPYVAALDSECSGRGVASLRAFVQGGGSYLGLCAGAYFASATLSFEQGTALEVTGERSLAFFAGRAVGSVTPGFSYNGEGCVLRVRYSSAFEASPELDDACLAYANGAPYFSSAPQAGVAVLARYADGGAACGDGQPAALRCVVGSGVAVLCGPHPEMSPRRAGDTGANAVVTAQLLASSEATRRFWRVLLAASRVPLRPVLTREESALSAVLGPLRSTSTIDLQTLPELPLPSLFSAAAPPPPQAEPAVALRRIAGWMAAAAALALAAPQLRSPAPRLARAARVAAGACACAAGAGVRVNRPADGIPITAQTFAACVCGLLLGPADGARATAAYALSAAAGLPVLAPAREGSREASQLSAGFVLGFTICATAVGQARDRCIARRAPPAGFAASAATAAAAGQLATVLLGGAWAGLILSRAGAESDSCVEETAPRPWLLELALHSMRNATPFIPGLVAKSLATGLVAGLAAPLLSE